MKKKIIVSLLNKKQDYQQLMANDAYETAGRAGFDVEVHFCDNNSVIQIRLLLHHINAKPDERPVTIIVEPVSSHGIENIARSAVTNGIGWIILDSHPPYLDTLQTEFPQAIISKVDVDNKDIGAIQAQQVMALLSSGGNILCVEGPNVSLPARARHEGFVEGLSKISNMNIEQTLLGNWTETVAEQVVSSWFRRSRGNINQINLVAAQNDAMALATKRIIENEQPGWKKIIYIGCDGLPQGGQDLVDKRIFAATIIKPSETGPAIVQLANYLQGNIINKNITLPVHSYPTLHQLNLTRGF
ncbi:MAG: substrate-binding domain-containing protein [Deltaproteobacteria bacterium]|nr:substrate-binding domain-containing protein [Deltaproteobacteria bacterium]